MRRFEAAVRIRRDHGDFVAAEAPPPPRPVADPRKEQFPVRDERVTNDERRPTLQSRAHLGRRVEWRATRRERLRIERHARRRSLSAARLRGGSGCGLRATRDSADARCVRVGWPGGTGCGLKPTRDPGSVKRNDPRASGPGSGPGPGRGPTSGPGSGSGKGPGRGIG